MGKNKNKNKNKHNKNKNKNNQPPPPPPPRPTPVPSAPPLPTQPPPLPPVPPRSILQMEAFDVAVKAFENNKIFTGIAQEIKQEFDRRYGPPWHCIVGTSFGPFVTYEPNHFSYFYVDKIRAVLLFKY